MILKNGKKNHTVQETTYIMNTPVRIALIADTHNHRMDHVLSCLRKKKPELICIAGDFVHARLPENGLKMEHSRRALHFLSACSNIALTVVSLGNHEWMLNQQDIDIIRSTGVILLDNEYVRLRKGSVDMIVGGLTSASHVAYLKYARSSEAIYPPLRPGDRYLFDCEPDTGWLDEFSMLDGYKILLCHHPEYYPGYLKEMNINLVLSGHAHGGQIRILGRGLYAPGQGILPELTSGLVDDRLLISRGLANNTIIPRWFNPPEIVYIL